jgi:hypothetical protein
LQFARVPYLIIIVKEKLNNMPNKKLSIQASALYGYDNHDGFVFKNSNKNTVEYIGRLLIKASELVD